tara:strand:+ start:52 stop:738 length:687 start_codon:yes stop_codon:yes gene_type:complete
MSEGIEDINVQLIEFGGENGVQALVKLDKTYRITISNEEIQNSMKDSVTSLTQEEMDELDNMPVIEDNSSPEQDTVLEQDADVNEETNPDDNIVKDFNSRLEELHNNFVQESTSQFGGQSLDQVSIAIAIALLNSELNDKTVKKVDLSQDDILERSNNESVLSTILEYGNNYLSIESIEELNIEKIENHLESIENEIKDKDFPKTQKSIEDVKESIDIIKMKNDMTNV